MAPKKANTQIAKNVSIEDLPISAGGEDSPRELTDRELLLKILDKLTKLEESYAEKPKKLTKTGPKKESGTQTTYSWFVDNCERDDKLFEAIIEGNNPEIWAYGSFRSKFDEATGGKTPPGDDTSKIRRKSAVILWTKCMKLEHRESIEIYHLNTSPDTFPSTRLKKISTLRDKVIEEPAIKPAKKPASKKAPTKKKIEVESSSSDSEPTPKPAPKAKSKKSTLPPPDSDSESD